MPPTLGAEVLPNKIYVSDLPLVVLVKDKDGKVNRIEHINYSNSEERKWLGKLTYHAVTSGMSVVTMAQKDYKPELTTSKL